ncbi:MULTISPECIES: hypothetical protein [Pseudomonas]|uniref:hypothetical protein n=1 Tax=Pseudomonas TaxID=286 RepID=UPI000BA4DFE2|nr:MULTISPECIES: hypothetical protein [Pseudomonas]MDR9862708.1 hypothetical protein [Pseudomonas baetica]
MIAPWTFQCENLHIQFDAKVTPSSRTADLLKLLDLNMIADQKMLLTISKMRSTCFSDNDFITSHEVILKVATTYNAVEYYFPLLAIVDAPHSIIRGALLGYTKHIGAVEITDTSKTFHWEGGDNSISHDVLQSTNEEITLHPHLTYRNFRTRDFQAKGFSTLDITDYSASPILKCNPITIDLPFLKCCGITPLRSYKLGFASDSFTVHGAQYV